MSYDSFAKYYDELTANIDYPALAEYYDSIISRFGGRKGILLDLACGTGSLSVLLSGRGYDVIGTDGSPEMLDIALSKPHEGIQYLCQDMTELDMFGTIDAAVCALDSLNHLESDDELREVFGRVSLFLNAGGVFVFDVNTPYKHEHILADSTYVYETDRVFCVWENEYAGEGVTEIQLDFFERNEDGTYTRSSDFFTETAWPREKIESLLKEAGFELCAVYEYPTLNEPGGKSEKLTFAARLVTAKNKEI
ncbi:MAG: methyltransferase domain-containing protein [Ruminiclostridium sp.]|nr:methyltransferase domain-containing protein [Ruminiclostridium sp.]